MGPRWAAAAATWAAWRLAGAEEATCIYTTDGGGLDSRDQIEVCTEAKVTYGYSDAMDVYILDAATGMAGTRCCENVATNPSQINLCGGDDGVNEPCKLWTFADAQAECDDRGMRLCTRAEVQGETSLGGCAYHHMHVWTSEAAICPKTDETSVTCRAIADGSGVDGPDDGLCPSATSVYDEVTADSWAAPGQSAAAGIRCCTTEGDAGHAECDADCQTFTFSEATATCQAIAGERLCTMSEVRNGAIASPDECGHPSMNVWTSDLVPCPTEVLRFDVVYGSGVVEVFDIEPGVNYVGDNINVKTLSIRAVVVGPVGSVNIQLDDNDGNSVHGQTENFPPFSLWGDVDGVYAGSPSLTHMAFGQSYTVTATPYVGEETEELTEGAPLTITFSLQPESNRPVPSTAPVPVPTSVPFPAPTGAPVGPPSNSPTAVPFPVPTASPVEPPSNSPTAVPSVSKTPTAFPTTPSVAPSLAPSVDTSVPSAAPTNQTDAPSAMPSPVPTNMTFAPTNSTEVPYPSPTAAPSFVPYPVPTAPCVEATLPVGQAPTKTSPVLYLVETVDQQVVQEIQDFPAENNLIYLHPDNDLSRNMVDVTGTEIPDVNELTLVADMGAANVSVYFVLYDLVEEATVINETWVTTPEGYAGLYGTFCYGWRSGLVSGLYAVWMNATDTSTYREFRLHPRENANLVPDKWRPKDDDTGRVDTLDIVPFAQTPRDMDRWDDRDYVNNARRDRLEKINRINFVTPGVDDGYIYLCMEIIAVVYRCPGDSSLTFTARSDSMEVWFDLKTAVEEATFDPSTGASRTINLETRQHSGLRTMTWHPNFKENGLVYFSYLETWDDSIPFDVYLSIYDDDEHERANADAVVAEFKVVNDAIDSSTYRPLFRIGYNVTGANYAVYEHPIKECAFPSLDPPYVLMCGSGDGSVDSSIAFGGQDNNIYGKIIAIDVGDGEYTQPYEYGIPAMNVFGNSTNPSACCASEHRQETFAIGLRNPHRISCLRKGTYKGFCFISDAGRDNAEEVNILMGPGANYGWFEREGHYVHLDRFGIADGVDPVLPEDDEKYGYIYPATFLGHDGLAGAFFTAQAIVGGPPVETEGSDFEGRYFFSNFPREAQIYYSMVEDLMNATTMGPPESLTLAPIYNAKLRYYASDAAYAANTPTGTYEFFNTVQNLLEDDPNHNENLGPNLDRTDLRIGQGIYGEMLIISKRVGTVYVVKNSMPGTTAKPFV